MDEVTYNFGGKVAIVTGATGGIGRATAILFGRSAGKVVVSGRREQEGAETVAAIEAAGGEAIFHRADVTIEGDMESLVKTALARFGRLDFAVNNAGAGMMGGLEGLSLDDWNREIARNAGAAFLGIKYQMPAMRQSGGGAIVNMASTAASVGLKNMGAYCAAKAAVAGLTRAAAAEGTECGIRVNSISIGPIRTDAWAGTSDEQLERVAASTPMGRMGRPEELASAAVWLCSAGASFVTGVCLAVDGGGTNMRAETLRSAGN